MKYIQSYHNYDQEMNEGLKNWVATFLMLANMGMVPSQIVSASAKEKQEFVEQQPQDKIDAALFAMRELMQKHPEALLKRYS